MTIVIQLIAGVDFYGLKNVQQWFKTYNIMKYSIIKYLLVPFIYIMLGTILFGNQELMIVIFLSFITIVYSYLIDKNKSSVTNFVEVNGVFILLFTVSLLINDSDKILILRYISLVILSYSTVYLLKNKKIISE